MIGCASILTTSPGLGGSRLFELINYFGSGGFLFEFSAIFRRKIAHIKRLTAWHYGCSALILLKNSL